MQTKNKQIANDILLNANVISDFMPLKNIYLYAITATISGSPSGTIKLQASADPETNDTQPDLNALKPTNFVDIADSSFAISSAGSTMWNVRDVAYNYVRVVYIDASGGTSSATMNVIFNGKGV